MPMTSWLYLGDMKLMTGLSPAMQKYCIQHHQHWLRQTKYMGIDGTCTRNFQGLCTLSQSPSQTGMKAKA